MIEICLVVLVILAVVLVMEVKARRMIILSSAFSMTIALAYILLAAPDVALAEIIIGSTLSTIILLVAVKKYRLFYLFYTGCEPSKEIVCVVENIIFEHELEMSLIKSNQSIKAIKKEHAYDLIIDVRSGVPVIVGDEKSYIIEEIKAALKEAGVDFND